ISSGSEYMRAAIEIDGDNETLREAGAVMLSTFYGTCVGQCDRKNVDVKVLKKILISPVSTAI
ncbi:hypothetical protein LZ31DRAFT_461846, partial [Colletotrichum somersetense]